jgi:hypothetical protein
VSTDGELYERGPEAWNAYLAEGNAKQARKRVSADAIVRDSSGRILLVGPHLQTRLGPARRHGRGQRAAADALPGTPRRTPTKARPKNASGPTSGAEQARCPVPGAQLPPHGRRPPPHGSGGESAGVSTDSAQGTETTRNNRHQPDNPDTITGRPTRQPDGPSTTILTRESAGQRPSITP